MEASGEDEEGKDGAVCLDSSQSGLEVQVTGARRHQSKPSQAGEKTHCLGSRRLEGKLRGSWWRGTGAAWS